MNPASLRLEPLVVGSIKDRVVCAVLALGESATRAAIRKSVECQSSVLEIAVDGLHRDGYLYVHERGHFAVDDEYASTLKLAEHGKVATAQSAAPSSTQPAAGATMSTKTICKECGVQKQKFGPCPTCGAKRRESRKNGQAAAAATRAAKPAAKPVRATITSQPNGEVIIPAAGEIRCRVFDAGAGPAYSLHQGDDQITLSREQLQALHGWAGAVLENLGKCS